MAVSNDIEAPWPWALWPASDKKGSANTVTSKHCDKVRNQGHLILRRCNKKKMHRWYQPQGHANHKMGREVFHKIWSNDSYGHRGNHRTSKNHVKGTKHWMTSVTKINACKIRNAYQAHNTR